MRPKLHYTSNKNWLNDPNGLCKFKGTYHLFHQYNPKNAYWGNMAWSHAVSEDMVRWREVGIAMEPSNTFDRSGCFSGSALVENDQITFAYTGVDFRSQVINEHGNPTPEPVEDMYCTQLFAYSEDGYKLEKNKELIIHAPKNIKQHEFRDPKLYKKDDKYYFIAVAMNKDDETGILIYESEDLNNWKVVNSYFTKEQGLMWECPDYFELDGQEVFFCSVIKSIYEDTEVVVYTTCDMESEIKLGEFSRIDYGNKFYAPQTFVDDDGRRLMIGWLRMEKPFLGEEWTGMMSVMRELSFKDGAIYQQPVKEIETYYKDIAVISCDGGSYSSTFAENIALDIRIDELQAFEAFNIYLDENQHISLTKEKEKIIVETNLNKDTRSYQFDNALGSIRMIKDRHALELFIDDGRYVISDYYEIHGEEFTVNVIGKDVVGQIHVVR